MKNHLKLLLLAITLIYSCNSDDLNEDVINEVPSRNTIDVKINDVQPVNSIRNLSASFCCDNKISVSFEHWVSASNGSGYGGLSFNLSLDKNGNLLGLWYRDYTHPNNWFYSPYFTPVSSLTIENFQFIENQILKFKISGQLFKQTVNFYAEPEFVTLDATIEIKDFTKCICSAFFSKVSNINGFIFDSVTKTQQGNDIKYFTYSNNGYHLEFLNFNESIQNMPLGVYEFSETATSHRIDFRKFIGVPRAFSNSIIPQEWLKYDTSGSFEIIERQQIGSETITKVKFNLTAKHNNEVVFQITNALLETPM
jgi:hypothetical protein